MAALRRLLLLVAVLGASTAGYVWWQRRGGAIDAAAPEWPPLPTAGDETAQGEPAGATASWVEPLDGSCPLSHPVKLNESSGIFHQPGGRFYERTNADRCYISAEAAIADGYRASKA